jgi:hypothetical protein
MSSIQREPRILLGLRADQFRHPVDLQATRSLQQVPGLGLLIQKLAWLNGRTDILSG